MILTPELQSLIESYLRLVMCSPEGHGEVTIVVTAGRIRLVTHKISVDVSKAQYPEQQERWYRQDNNNG